MNEPDYTVLDKGYYFKFYNPTTDIKLIRFFLEDNGFMFIIEFKMLYDSNKNADKKIAFG